MIDGIECSVLRKIILVLHKFIVAKVLPMVLRPIVIISLNILLTSLSINHLLKLAALRPLAQEPCITALLPLFVFVLPDEIHNIHLLQCVLSVPSWACLLHLTTV